MKELLLYLLFFWTKTITVPILIPFNCFKLQVGFDPLTSCILAKIFFHFAKMTLSEEMLFRKREVPKNLVLKDQVQNNLHPSWFSCVHLLESSYFWEVNKKFEPKMIGTRLTGSHSSFFFPHKKKNSTSGRLETWRKEAVIGLSRGGVTHLSTHNDNKKQVFSIYCIGRFFG